MTTFTFTLVDEASGTRAEARYVMDDKEGQRILACYDHTGACKGDYQQAFAAMAQQMMESITSRVCTWERANAADPIVPKPE